MAKLFSFNKAPPALIALFIQVCAFVLAALLCWLAIQLGLYLEVFLPGSFVELAVLLTAQGVFAYFLSIRLRMAYWWRYIHLLFPFAILMALVLQIPTGYFLLGFIVTGALFWSVFITQVPFYPSKPEVWDAVSELLPGKQLRILEIGSGLGNFAIRIAQLRPESQVEGIEIAPLPWLISTVQAKLFTSRVRFRLGNYEKVNFSDYDLIFAYLSPAAMPELWDKALLEMNSESLLISHEFPVPGIDESQKMGFSSDQRECFVYVIGQYRPT
ncbi:bifunctional 2-polyprenyl-6-hydroxyphenol methylase/3-demethylubiquinol 3-O-methyltransferase UbiG [Polynucleobacter sp. AP-Kaivos-20-H2]|uniref:class I SAM-dependent methyltransferase n=1 Tax=Polynucleobacter sp. AP-Kaivos-20-H2 TaxID=2689104 RepID=UPI001C0C4935|nr:class I SAM-dependent methyltransferase [Polynucleobacter sp. AP-Kaivos-20-H2]MBU3603356.1 class I SAM-dependent methyltransferase [Polynucleobacter sp. AP-Kaivos-20-H2]